MTKTAPQKVQKKGAPPCGLYLRLTSILNLKTLEQDLRQFFFVINSAPYEKNMHVIACEPEFAALIDDERMLALVQMTQAQGMVFLFINDTERADVMNADGVLLDKFDDIKTARDILGDERIVGLRCGLDIDAGETAVNNGADFVSFHTSNGALTDPKIAAIWSTLSTKPCLMEGPFTNDYVPTYANAGATLLDVTDYIWEYSKGIMQATVNMLHAIELGLADEKIAN